MIGSSLMPALRSAAKDPLSGDKRDETPFSARTKGPAHPRLSVSMPAHTLVAVAALAMPEYLIEVEAVAAL